EAHSTNRRQNFSRRFRWELASSMRAEDGSTHVDRERSVGVRKSLHARPQEHLLTQDGRYALCDLIAPACGERCEAFEAARMQFESGRRAHSLAPLMCARHRPRHEFDSLTGTKRLEIGDDRVVTAVLEQAAL